MKNKANAKGKDFAAFRAVHDKSYAVPKRIREALAELGESWEYEADLVRRCGVSHVDFAKFKDAFLEHCVETQRVNGQSHAKRVWAGTKAFAAKLREVSQ